MVKIKIKKKKGALAFSILSNFGKQEWADKEGEFYISLEKPKATDAQRWFFVNEVIIPYSREVTKMTGEYYTLDRLECQMMENIGMKDVAFLSLDKSDTAMVISKSIDWMKGFFDHFTGTPRTSSEITAAVEHLQKMQRDYIMKSEVVAAEVCRIRAELVNGNRFDDSVCGTMTKEEKEELKERTSIAIDYRNGVCEVSELLEI